MAWWIHGRHRHNRNTSVLEHDMSKKSGELERGVGVEVGTEVRRMVRIEWD